MRCLLAFLALSLLQAADRITVLYDSTAVAPLLSGWGYSALVEYQGKRILFDAGGSPLALEANTKKLHIDLTRLDAVVISHDDPDHYAGLNYLHAINPKVAIYVPEQDSGAFSPSVFNGLLRWVQSVLPGQHIVDPPSGATYVSVASGLQLFPGVRIISLPFDSRREQALVLDVPGGAAVLTGCAHPGIVQFVKLAGSPVRLATGGFHLIKASEPDIRRDVQLLQLAGVQSVYPAHCTGPLATQALRRTFGAKCITLGVGGVVPLPR